MMNSHIPDFRGKKSWQSAQAVENSDGSGVGTKKPPQAVPPKSPSQKKKKNTLTVDFTVNQMGYIIRIT